MSHPASWKLTDVDERISLDSFELNSGEGATRPGTGWSIRKQTLHGGLCEGVDLIEIDNGRFRFSVVPTRGMGLWKGECDGCAVGWNSPVRGPVNPKYVSILDRGGLGWLQGFDECVVRCGLESNGPPVKDVVPDNNGNAMEIPLTLHGRIANLPAHKVEVQVNQDEDLPELAVVGEVDESMLFFPQLRLVSRISTVAGSNAVTIEDEIINLKGGEAELELLYHCNFGAPFLEKGSRLVAPIVEVAPRDARAVEGVDTYNVYAGPVSGYVEQCYFYALKAAADGTTLTLLRNAAGDKGIVVRFNTRELPCFTQWKNTVGLNEGYVTGLEPGINFPNAKGFEREQKRVVKLAPGASYRVRLVLEVCGSADAVHAAEDEIRKLQGKKKPVVHAKPIAKFSPAK
ncbi:MAG: hypothetical protein A3K19_12615 [Lentisphaerae bacterium RIFOXYB12_FULL_65_16]|nr:MAG: hypothetical protein A3K18_24435 [Lentisphaerae bacterium RIFOXYA12_64_32]OGV88066.1 MAG: hypothetical protein A3K19_12615 [Lentisphaerae bacterium RIFOXYB12_FULL_65_16]